jgi:hypothetical protein
MTTGRVVPRTANPFLSLHTERDSVDLLVASDIAALVSQIGLG